LTAVLAASKPIDPPLSVAFRLSDGVKITGAATAWDAQGIDGGFGRRPWPALHPDDRWRVFRRVMDPRDAEHWLTLGGLMLEPPDATDAPASRRRAEEAFREALKLDASLQPRIEQVRRDAAARRQPSSPDGSPDASPSPEPPLRSSSPEAGPWTAEAWPVLTPAEQDRATATLRAQTERMLLDTHAAGGAAIEAVETARFSLSGDLPRTQLAEWSWQLEELHQAMTAVLDRTNAMPGAAARTAGKIVVVALSDRARLDRLQRQQFRHVLAGGQRGIAQFRGIDAIVMVHVDGQLEAATDALLRYVSLALLHRHRSPARLPAWANEGLAAHLAGELLPGTRITRERLHAGRAFLREDGRIGPLMNISYDDAAWTAAEPTVTATGMLIVQLMLRERPDRFAAWIQAVKSGTAWEEALQKGFGSSREQLIRAATSYYQVND
jgi:hypothetical protein